MPMGNVHNFNSNNLSNRRQTMRSPMSIASLINPNPERTIRQNVVTSKDEAKEEDVEDLASAVRDAAQALSATTVSEHSSTAAGVVAGDDQPLVDAFVGDKTELARERSRKRQEYVTSTVSAQAGQLLQRIRQLVRRILDLCLSDTSAKDSPHSASKAVAGAYPGLERVLVDLFNAILTSHTDQATREISSQKLPVTARPAFIHSLDHLRVLLYGYTDETNDIPLDHTPPNKSSPGMASPADREIYMSTLEFLGLMTAFVSVVCWLMDKSVQCGLDQAGWDPVSVPPPSSMSFSPTHQTHGDYQMGQSGFHLGSGPHQMPTSPPNIPKDLLNFLALFSNRDNFMRPIRVALSRTDPSLNMAQEFTLHDPAEYIGLFTWHFYLFASQGLEQMGREMVDESVVGQIQFDVVLNDLYSTHVLGFSAKEHQKDHGQFYTPPSVVDFMWRRTLRGHEDLLGDFRAFLSASYSERAAPKWYQDPSDYPTNSSPPALSLIPSVLDPCLGVSTFLSYYIREVIWQAQQDSSIWGSEIALSLLMSQIVHHTWGVELDGFAFWIARCGILAALVPLVQRIQVLKACTYNETFRGLSPPPSSPSPLVIQGDQHYPRLHLFCADTLQLTMPQPTEHEDNAWERECIRQLRDPSLLRVSFVVTNPPYMIRKTGTFSTPDPEVYDMSILGGGPANRGRASSRASNASVSTVRSVRGSVAHLSHDEGQNRDINPSTGAFAMVISDEQQQSARSTSQTPEATLPIDEDELELAPSANTLAHPGVRRFSRRYSTSTKMSSSPSRSRQSTPQHQSMQLSPASTPASVTTAGSVPSKTSFKGMMQAYGYFIWFATQRIVPQDGVVCMITASQWLTLEFAINLRGWLMDHCFVDELFQFEPYKVFARVQTDSLIFKLRSHATDTMNDGAAAAMDMTTQADQSQTLFLRHLDSRSSLKSTLNDYGAFADHLLAPQRRGAEGAESDPAARKISPVEESNVVELTKRIAYALKSRATLKSQIRPPTFSFAPMMPSTALSEYLLSLTAHLGGLCTAGTKRASRQSSLEPLLWHRGPNTNPVYGLVVRMEYALATFGEVATHRWFRPAFYWNGKNAPDGPETDALTVPAPIIPTTSTTAASSASTPNTQPLVRGYADGSDTSTAHGEATSSSSSSETKPLGPSAIPLSSDGANIPSSQTSSTASTPRPMPPGLHREGQFWFYRDRHRLSRKEGSPAESYVVPKSGSERQYMLCMVDKEAIKVLRKEVEDGVAGAEVLWQYLSDVRSHFQPGLVNKRAAAAAAAAAAATTTAVTPNASVPANRLDEDSIAYCSTSQCGADIASKIIHPINYGYFSKTQPRQRFLLDTSSTAVTNQCIYLTLNSGSVLHSQLPPLPYFLALLNSSMMQYFVLRHCQYDQQGRMRLFRESMAKIPYQPDIYPERVQYATQLGEHMMRLKEALYKAVTRLELGPLGVLEWIRRGGEASPTVVANLREHLRVCHEQGRLPVVGSWLGAATIAPSIDATTVATTPWLSGDPGRFAGAMSPSAMEVDGIDPGSSERIMVTAAEERLERLVAVLTRAIGTVDLLQWAVDQYGFMLYGVGLQYQHLLEEELKIVYSSQVIQYLHGNRKEEDSPPLSIRLTTTENDNDNISTFNNRSSYTLASMAIDSADHSLPVPPPEHSPSMHHQRQLSFELYRWDTELPQGKNESVLPAYAAHILEDASSTTRELLRLIE
ncbi:hypothetical protein BGZ73_002714 [Actinomortierella ambigua]|nr:hypothetical protein BGZ73_002714 [Actinomortierella ambigua]